MVDSAHVKIADYLDRRLSGNVPEHPFFYFEPFSVAERPEWVKTAAKKDGDPTYFIFVSDGNPTCYMNTYHTGGYHGDGDESSHRRAPIRRLASSTSSGTTCW